jgi:hypothetical protein
MAESQRIEDLRKRYHEHPRRFFAPLANEYRKAGFLDRSILLCEKHLKEQPDNMNGLVVFGQTLFELGKLEEAKEPFTTALGLDPENLIALRHLGDIARLGGDVAEARRWYGKVLEVDRRNDDVLDLLEQLGGAEGDAASTSGTGPLVTVAPSVSVSGGDENSRLGMIDLDGPAPEPPAAPAVPAAPAAPAVPAAPAASAGRGRTVVIDAAALAAADLAATPTPPTTPKPTPHSTPKPTPHSTPKPTPHSTPRPFGGAGSTVVINAQALADADLRDAHGDAPPAPTAPPAPRPSKGASKRASILDVAFDFSEFAAEEPTPLASAAPAVTDHGDEIGLAASTSADALIIDSGPVAEPMSAGGTMPGLESSEVTGDAESGPLAGLEVTEFAPAEAAPLAGLEPTEVESAEVAPLSGLESAAADVLVPPEAAPTLEIAAIRPVTPPGPAFDDLPPLEGEPSTAPLPLLDLDVPAEPADRPKPRMTKANMASLPLIADFGLDEDEPPDEPPSAPLPAQSAAVAHSEPEAAPEPEPAPEPARAAAPTPVPAPAPTPASGPGADEPRKPQKTPAFVTETMAALYLTQGFRKEAIEVYRQLIQQDPSDTGMRERLAALERSEDSGLDFEEPAPGAAEPPPAPANTVLDEVSFDGVGLKTPAPAATPMAMPAPVGPSARDFFSAFARRGAAVTAVAAAAAPAPAPARAPAPTPAPVAAAEPIAVEELAVDEAPAATPAAAGSPSGWPLDALFGAPTDAADEHSAAVIASIGTFAGPTGGTGLDELFAAADDVPRAKVARASETLKFDQFFSSPQSVAEAAAPDSPAAPATPDTPATPAAAGDDDLDQFQGWLRGLKP